MRRMCVHIRATLMVGVMLLTLFANTIAGAQVSATPAAAVPSAAVSDEMASAGFRVLPYVQNPTDSAVTIVWFTERNTPGELHVDGVGTFRSEPMRAVHLYYSEQEIEYIHGENNFGHIFPDVTEGEAPAIPYRHAVRVGSLAANMTYDYTVKQPGGQGFSAQFQTAPAIGERTTVRFIAMSDMETEPESTNKPVTWARSAAAIGGDKLATDPDTYARTYYIDQTDGFKANLLYAQERRPDFWVIAGDLVEKGGRQLDWDEFFRHTAGGWSTLASTTPIFPALGNHENYWHPEEGGYSPDAVMRSYDKYATYWDVPANNASNPRHEKRYYRVDYGPVTLITLDSSNGDDMDVSRDTNLMIDGEASHVPDFNVGSEQWHWAVRQLADAQAKGQITFVQFHHMAFGTGVHSLVSGTAGIANNEDSQSGMPMRIYHDLFKRYGVTAVFSGHDELLEYAQLDGVHYWDVGFAGDGLRGPGYAPTTTYVPFDLLPEEAQKTHWSAHGDVPEIWIGDQLVDGGKHYGFLEVDVRPVGAADYEVVMTPRYAFPLMDEHGQFIGEFDFRQYPKVVKVLIER